MASGNSGSFTISGTKYMSAVCYWSETYNVSANTHVVSIDKLMLKSSNWYGFTYYLDGSVSVNGTAVATFSSGQGTHNCTVSSQNTEYKVNSSSAPSPWTSGSITGNADGTKSVSIALKFKGYTIDGSGANAFSIDSSQTVTLYTIPRKSSVSMSSGTLGSASTISISRASSSFTHTLSYAFGSASGTITTKTTSTSVSWTPALSLAKQIPNSTSGKVTITCSTYSGTTLIGSSTTTATLSVPTSVKPTLSALNVSRVDGDVPSSWGIYVQTKSQATLGISGAAGSYGSSISAYSISGGGYSSTSSSFTTGTLNSSGTVTFTAKVKDSRGRWSDEKTVSISVVAYSAPSFSSYTAQRCTSAGTVSANGTYCKSTVTFNYSACSSKNSITTATYYKKSTESSYTSASTTFSSGTAFTFGGGNLATDYSYDIKFTLTDAFTTVSVVMTLSTASVLMDFKSGGTGLAIGKVSEKDLLEVAMDAEFSKTASIEGDLSAKANVSVGQALTVDGATTLSGALKAAGGATVDGVLTLDVDSMSTSAANILTVNKNTGVVGRRTGGNLRSDMGIPKIQYGTVSMTFKKGTSTTTSVTFSTAFSSTPVVIVQQVFDTANALVYTSSVSTTGFTITIPSTLTTSGTRATMWVAIGN